MEIRERQNAVGPSLARSRANDNADATMPTAPINLDLLTDALTVSLSLRFDKSLDLSRSPLRGAVVAALNAYAAFLALQADE